MKEGVTLEQAKQTFRDAGISDDYNDTSVFLYSSHREELAPDQTVWFSICVSEQSIADFLYALSMDVNVSTVSPNFISRIEDVEIETATEEEISEADT
jgi:hypothetical protein